MKTKEGYSKGHAHPKRFIQDCRKYNEASLRGWSVFRFPVAWVESGEAIAQLEKAFMNRGQRAPNNKEYSCPLCGESIGRVQKDGSLLIHGRVFFSQFDAVCECGKKIRWRPLDLKLQQLVQNVLSGRC